MRRPIGRQWRKRMPGRVRSRPRRFAGPTIWPSPFVLPDFCEVRPQPIARGLSVTVRQFHQVGFAGDVTLAGNSGDEVIRRLHAVAGRGEFVAQMLRTLGRGILRTVADKANTRRLDERNQLVDFRLRLPIQRRSDRSGEEQGKDGSEKLAHEIDVSVAHDAQSSHSIGSQLITWALMRFMRSVSGSE